MAPRLSVKANVLSLDALKPGAGKYEVAIAGYRGLVVRVWPSGERKFLLRYRLDGRLTRVRLDAPTLAEAIKEWAKDRHALTRGEDPGQVRRQARLSARAAREQDRRDPTVAALTQRYLTEHVRPNLKSAPEVERILTRSLPSSLTNEKVKAVTRAGIKALVSEIATKGGKSGRPAPVMANRTLAVLSGLFAFAVEADLVGANPCLGITRPAKESARDRRLEAGEIRNLWKWTAAMPLPPAIAVAMRFQLLTGARASEVLAARWSEIKGNTWEIPATRSKSSRARQVPLSRQALQVLRGLRHKRRYVFEAIGSDGHVRLDAYVHAIKQLQVDAVLVRAGATLTARERERISEQAAAAAWRSHDLRRSAASGMADLGASREVIALTLGHQIPGVTSRYDRGERLAEKRVAIESWGRHVQALVRAPARRRSNVVKFPRHKHKAKA